MNPDNNNILILGAGASMDYGFPSGHQLIEDILGLLEPQQDLKLENLAILWIIADHENLRTLIQETIRPVNDRINIHHALKMIQIFQEKLNLSGPRSIDDFIKQHPRLATFSKICIALCISEYEKENDTFFANFEKNKYRIKRGWYQWLWGFIYQNMGQDPKIETIKDRFKKLKFITFNYDRSLERFLSLRLKHFYNLDDEQISNIVSDTTIHHVYGQIGQFHTNTENKTHNPYKSLLEDLRSINIGLTISFQHENISNLKNGLNHNDEKKIIDIIDIAKQIKTYSESTSESINSFPMISQISNSNKFDYYFFGFSYNKINLELLKNNRQSFTPIMEGSNGEQATRFFGTVFELTKNEKQRAKESLKSIFSEEPQIILGESDQKIEDFINSLE